MPERLHIRHTTSDIKQQLRRYIGAKSGRLEYVVASSTKPKHPTNAVGASPMIRAVEKVSTVRPAYTLLALGIRDPLSEVDRKDIKDRSRMAYTLRDVLEDLPSQFKEMRIRDPLLASLTTEELMDRHFDVVRMLNNLSSSPDALADSLKRAGITTDPDQYLADFFGEQEMAAAAFVDAAIASWIDKKFRSSQQIILERDDWSAHSIRESLSKEQADIGVNQSRVPTLAKLRQMHPKIRDYQILLYTTMAYVNSTVVLHTEHDRQNLAEIAAYASETKHPEVTINQQGTLLIRNLMPTGYEDIRAEEGNPNDASPFFRKAVYEGKIIMGETGKLDLFKRNLVLLDNLSYLIDTLPADQNDILDKLRIALVARPKEFPQDSTSRVKPVYAEYERVFEQKVAVVNKKFRERMHRDEDFVLVHRDKSGKLAGMPQEKLRRSVMRFLDISVALGEEGLNLANQETTLERIYGLEIPKPHMSIIAADTGFAEKARAHGLGHVLVVSNPYAVKEFIQKLLVAIRRVEDFRASPNSFYIKNMRQNITRYYENVCADGFHAEVLEELIRKKMAKIRN